VEQGAGWELQARSKRCLVGHPGSSGWAQWCPVLDTSVRPVPAARLAARPSFRRRHTPDFEGRLSTHPPPVENQAARLVTLEARSVHLTGCAPPPRRTPEDACWDPPTPVSGTSVGEVGWVARSWLVRSPIHLNRTSLEEYTTSDKDLVSERGTQDRLLGPPVERQAHVRLSPCQSPLRTSRKSSNAESNHTRLVEEVLVVKTHFRARDARTWGGPSLSSPKSPVSTPRESRAHRR
jgi:hypothetical protein